MAGELYKRRSVEAQVGTRLREGSRQDFRGTSGDTDVEPADQVHGPQAVEC